MARIASLSVFTLVLIIFLLSDTQKKIRELVFTQSSNNPLTQKSPAQAPHVNETPEFVEVIDLPEYGDIVVKKTVPKKKETKPEKQTAKPRVTKKKKKETPQVVAPPVSKPVTKETFPRFELDYANIGLGAYLQMAERIGKLYVILREEHRFGLGPAISFTDNRLEEFAFGEHYRKRYLAEKRPYWVTDPDLNRHLGLFNLPLNHLPGQLVLFLKKSFDEQLWRTLERELAEQNYKLSDITSVKGQYEREAQIILIVLETAETKTKETVHIGTTLPIPCETCL